MRAFGTNAPCSAKAEQNTLKAYAPSPAPAVVVKRTSKKVAYQFDKQLFTNFERKRYYAFLLSLSFPFSKTSTCLPS